LLLPEPKRDRKRAKREGKSWQFITPTTTTNINQQQHQQQRKTTAAVAFIKNLLQIFTHEVFIAA